MSYPYKVSMWPNAKATSAIQRTDVEITCFRDLFELFANDITPVANKIDQRIITRRRQESRARDNTRWKPPYLITLDYDSVDETPGEVASKLYQADISCFVFTTWTHKTIETPQKKNNGKNCFKVMLELTADNQDELLLLTKGLGALVGKFDINKNDDISSGIFLKGAHPDFIQHKENFFYSDGQNDEDTRKYLLDNVPEEAIIKKDPLDDFEQWDKTVGQKWTPERIKRALSIIKYEEVEDFTKMSIWYSIGYALHSTGDIDNFELWDGWCLDNCAEHGTYNREENENFWAKQTIPEEDKKLCTLSTLWHLEKLFKAKQATSAIRQSSWGFFDTLANTEPEEVKFLIKDLLVEQSIGFLVGTGGVGKSSLCLEIAKAVASGNPFFGEKKYETIKGTVAVINKEDSGNKVHNQIHNLVDLDIERLGKKANAFAGFGDPGDPEPYIASAEEIAEIKEQWANVARPQWAQSNIRLTNVEGEDLEALGAVMGSLKSLQAELVEAKKPPLSLVIFDPLNLWHGGDQNSQKDMSYIFSAFQQIQRELNVTVLIVHHMNKSNGFSGSHTIRDSGRFMWYLKPLMIGKEESDKFIDFYIEKNNDAKSNYTALQFIRTSKGLLDIADITGEDVEKGE